MNVTKEENTLLHSWIGDIRSSYMRIKKGQTPTIKLTPDRMRVLGQIGFDFENAQRVEEHDEIIITKTVTAANKSEDEEMEDIDGDVIPRWLLSDEEEEDKNDNSMFDEISINVDEISINVDGGIKVEPMEHIFKLTK